MDIFRSCHLLPVPYGVDEDLLKDLVVIRDEGDRVVDPLIIWIYFWVHSLGLKGNNLISPLC